MALDAFAVENTMNPEPVEAGLLDGDDWEDPVKTVSRLLLNPSGYAGRLSPSLIRDKCGRFRRLAHLS